MRTVAELVLGREPDAVPRARRLVRSALREEMPDVAGDAELVVSELVTNAILHGEAPITVRVMVNRVARIEVHDTGRSVPILLKQKSDAMTGRGLSMVAAVASEWGVEPEDVGKTVWAELSSDGPPEIPAPAIDLDALLEAWADDDPATATYTVKLGPVSTELLLSAKSHIDNVVRELSLIREGEASSGVTLPPELSTLIQTVTVEFAEARTEIKRQAAAAASRGDVLTELELHLTLSAADAGERYLTALDRADRYARSAHLLTLAPPRIHRVFRQWYVRTIIEQLRALSRGEEPPPATPFQSVLGEEVTRLDEIAAASERLAMMQRVSSELAAAVSTYEMARIAVDRAVEFLGVESARVRIVEDGYLRSVAWRSRSEKPDHQLRDLPLDSHLPSAVALRTGEPVHIRSLVETFGTVPGLAGHYEPGQSGHAVPLVADGAAPGVLSLTFAEGELTDDAELAFVSSLAEVLAHALRRSDALGGERHSVSPGEGLDRVPAAIRAVDDSGTIDSMAVLAGQRDILERLLAGDPLPAVLDSLVSMIETVGQPGSIGSVLLLEPDGAHLRHGASRHLPAGYVEAIDGVEIGPNVGSCGTAAYTRSEVVVEDIAIDRLWDDYRHLALPAGLRACWSTPIVAGDGELLGTFAVYYPQPNRPSDVERELVGLLVRTAAVAISRARADELREEALRHEQSAREELERAHANLRFILEATTRVTTSLDSDDTLRTLARIAVPALADVCLIDLLDGLAFRRAATAASPVVPAEAASRLDQFAPDLAGEHPAAVALRTGGVVFVESMDDEFIRRATSSDEHFRFVQAAHGRSCMAIPLAARGRTIGAMTLVLVEGGRSFSESEKSMVEDLGRRVALAIDNTQLYQSTREAERRLALVARAGVMLTSSLELATVVARLNHLIQGEVADGCEIHVRRTPDQWWHLAPDSGSERLIRAGQLPPLVAEAVETRSTVIIRSSAAEAFTAEAALEGEAAITVVPLIAHGDVVGVISLVSPGANESTRVPAETLEVIAGRAALAIDNALLYEQERTAAEILQRSLLPHNLPTVDGVRFAARYLPAGARNEIGGDWYDVFRLSPDRIGIVMGDVMGRGIPAASIMGQLRNGLRMLAVQDTDPGEALQLLNRMLGADSESPLATVACGVIDIGSRTLELANAGHLPPLLIRRSAARYLDQKPALPLGAFADTEYASATFELEAGDAVVLYTDGLIEQRDRSLDEGLDALVAAGEGMVAADPDEICDALLSSFRRGSDEDDTAVLALVLE